MLSRFLRLRLFLYFGLLAGCHVPAQPLLLSVTNDAGRMVLSWPATVPDAVLEQSSLTNLPPAWSPISPLLYQSNATGVSFRLSTVEDARAFRLRRTSSVAGLTGSWGLDETQGLSAHNLNGSGPALNTTNMIWGSGRFGAGSLQFNGLPLTSGGSQAWISNLDHQVLPPDGQPFSISLWFNPETLPVGSRTIIGTGDAIIGGWHLDLNSPGPGTNYLALTSLGNGSATITGRTLLLPGQWQRLTISSQTNHAAVYLNHQLLAEGPLSLVNTAGPLYLGALPDGPGTFHGRIDEIRTFAAALSPGQLSLSGEWLFNEGAGGVAGDSSPQGHLASVMGTNAWVSGKSGGGIDLATASIVIPNEQFRVLPASGGAFSISAWVQPRALPIGRSALFSSAQGTHKGWEVTVTVETTGKSWIEFASTGSGGTLDVRAPFDFTEGVWTKIDLTYDGGNAGLFVNGTKLASASGAIRGSDAPLVVGAAPGAANFNGLIDELKIYGYARAESEIGPVALPMWEMALVNTATNLMLKGSGPAGKRLTFSILPNPTPSLGTIDLSPESGVITYRAGAQKGPDQFVYTVSDGEFTSPPATGSVSVVQPHWISPGGGTATPLDGSSPSRAMAPGPDGLDQIWKTYNYYDCFFYAPGVYETTGARYLLRSTANPGCKHIGSGTEGLDATTIKLVNNRSDSEEGVIFSTSYWNARADGFEVHNLVLDCNAQNNPKYSVGEPVTLRVPLSTTGWVERVNLRWSDVPSRFGPPSEFKLCSRPHGGNGILTNCLDQTSTALSNEVTVGALTDELQIHLTKRAAGVDFYTLQELEVFGPAVSLPTAKRLDGTESRLGPDYSIVLAADGDTTTSWASGPEDQVQITLPLERGTVLNQMDLQWNCLTLPDLRRLGPAAQFVVNARDSNTGQWRDVPFTVSQRTTGGVQTVVFGKDESTDQLMLLLTGREEGVGFYGLKEVKLRHGGNPVSMRLPTASSTLAPHSILKAFDGDLQKRGWASGTQGSISAVDLRGSNLKFTGLKVIGFGTKAMRECFPLAVFNSIASTDNPPLRNILVEDCLFTQPATNNTDGISVVSVAGVGAGSIINGIISRCTVTGVGQYFAYSHAFGGNRVEDCFADGVTVGVYFEPTPKAGEGINSFGSVLIRSNLFLNVVRGVSVDFHPDAHFEALSCIGNEIVLSGVGPRGYGIGACDTCVPGVPGTITNLTVLNNIIRYPGWASRPGAPEQGIRYTDIQHAVFANNIIALGTDSPLRVRDYPSGIIPAKTVPESCDRPGIVAPGPSITPPSLDSLLPGYRRAWYNNRHLSGALLPVRHYLWGTDRPASQQQWPE